VTIRHVHRTRTVWSCIQSVTPGERPVSEIIRARVWLPGNVSTIKGDPSQFGPNAPGYTWVRADDVEPIQVFPGITVKLLWQGDNGAKAAITTIEPGAIWGGEDHHSPGPEEVYVVSGVLNDGVNDYPAGTFLHAPAGSWHVPQSTEGCVLFLFYPEG
jgi:quercetin dioxygenase-like cupin family protein